MEPIYVIGHRNPDTDSIVSAMAYAQLRNALGDRRFLAGRLGEVSDETQRMLDRFGFEAPVFIKTVRTQVKDLDFDTPPVLSSAVTINHAWQQMHSAKVSVGSLPVTDENGILINMITADDIAQYDINTIHMPELRNLPLFNLLSTLEGQILNDADYPDTLSGELMIALPQARLPENYITENTILICGDQPDMIRTAIAANAACIIICESDVDKSVYEGAEKTCIISTPYDAYRAARLAYQALPISRIISNQKVVGFSLDAFLDDVEEITLSTRHRSYPITDADGKVAGTLSRFHLLRPKRKRVVLVDHNEVAQSVPGLDQAEIIEIIDHHRLADVQTGAPIYMRNEPVGSTTTIIAGMYQERGIMPSPKLAGLMAAAIISDTVIFKSPTCTERDRKMAERMARIGNVSLDELGRDIFSATAAGRDPKALVFSDFKEFHIAGHSLGIGQITCCDSEEILQLKDELLSIMHDHRSRKHYDLMLLMVTDVLQEGTALLVSGDPTDVENSFNVEVKDNFCFLPGVISRKKQIVPALSLLWA